MSQTDNAAERMPKSRRGLKVGATLGGAALAVGAGILYLSISTYALRVTVEYHGPAERIGPLNFQVRGDQRSLDELRRGETGTVELLPLGDSELAVEFEEQGRHCRLVKGYVQRGYRLHLSLDGCEQGRWTLESLTGGCGAAAPSSGGRRFYR